MKFVPPLKACCIAIFAPILAVVFAFSSAIHGQDSATRPADLLGDVYKNSSWAIQLRPPASSVINDRYDPEVIVEFDRPDLDWQLKVWRIHLDRSLPLTIHKDQFGQPQDGMMEDTIASLKQALPNARVLRNEVIDVGKTGMLSLRYETATQDRRLTQHAIIDASDSNDQLYYCLELNSPGKPMSEPDEVENPGERLAYSAFAQVVDSVVLLNRAGVKEDQDERLTRAQALEVRWTGSDYETIRNALVPEQWQRIVRDGQDIGYSYIVEEFDENAKPIETGMMRIGVRTRLKLSPNVQWDSESWYKGSLDRKKEIWTFQGQATNPKGDVIDSFTQIGNSTESPKVVTLRPPPGAVAPVGQPPDKEIENVRSMSVITTHGTAQLAPFNQDTPQFYLASAYSFLLPSIVPLDRQTGYMWAVFVPSTPTYSEEVGRTSAGGHIMSRYIDVLSPQQITFDGRTYDAIVVNDRLTLDGAVTSNYFDSAGKFLGSSSTVKTGDKTTTVQIIPTDNKTLERIWSRPDLTRPGEAAPSTPQ